MNRMQAVIVLGAGEGFSALIDSRTGSHMWDVT